MKKSLIAFAASAIVFGMVAAHGQKPGAGPVTSVAAEREYFTVTNLEMPQGEVLEVSALDLMPSGQLAVATRRGEIWLVKDPSGTVNPSTSWSRFAAGLHEPLGLAASGGWLYATQRPELTRIKDSDGDGKADIFETVSSSWGINGDYHEYAFGTRPDKDGNVWVVLCLTGSGSAKSLLRGWSVKISPDGKTTPLACGIRSPGGIGFGPTGDCYYTDNQGLWNGSSSLKHLKPGSFQGNPTSNGYFNDLKNPRLSASLVTERPPEVKSGSRTVTERAAHPMYVPPAVMIPHARLGQSPTGIVYDTSGKFGPFKGQLFVGEQCYSQVQRVFIEEVNGVKQGAVFPFLNGFGSGNIAMLMSNDGVLYTGGSDRGWGAKGGKPFALERVNWTGKMPFEIHEIRAKPDGFELTFTEAADVATLSKPESYEVEAWTYIYQSSYGSPEVDKVTPTITNVAVGKDGRSVRLTLSTLTKGHLHAISVPGVRSGAGKPVLHPIGYYTLNEIPTR